jgi:hypothetical protein
MFLRVLFEPPSPDAKLKADFIQLIMAGTFPTRGGRTRVNSSYITGCGREYPIGGFLHAGNQQL